MEFRVYGVNLKEPHLEKKNTRWWDKLGAPQYGGEMTIRIERDIVNFDPYFTEGLTGIYGAWLERLVCDDWTQDPDEWDYRIAWHPMKYQRGNLAESWEFPDPATHIIHLRKGIHYPNVPPSNGREFTSDDVLFHYHRIYGLGGGFTKPSPYRDTDIRFKDLISLSAPDKYTVVFKFKTPNPDFIMETLHNVSLAQCLENYDVVNKYGDMRDWHHALGTGPFMMKNFEAGKIAELEKNPDYWGHDERHPQNKIPYIDKLRFAIIPDEAAAVTAMAAGKIDCMNQVSYKGARQLKQTNPEIIQIATPGAPALTLQPRNDKPPYNDLRVRKAIQMAVDLHAIARDYYEGSVDPTPSTLTADKYMKGWGFPYADWPEDLKAEYAYNPAGAKKLLAEAGYPHGFKTNVVATADSDFALLKIVQNYFADIGIEMEIRVMKTPDWIQFVEIDRKHDQLIYRPYGPLGHTYAPLRAITRFQTGYSANHMMVADPVFDSYYPKALAADTEDKLKVVLRDANERVARQHYALSLLLPLQYSVYQPWLKGFNAQVHSIWMGSGGPSMIGFYASRFWIDQTIKKKYVR
jgi:peptide/nickel transport system substrate-binding protein